MTIWQWERKRTAYGPMHVGNWLTWHAKIRRTSTTRYSWEVWEYHGRKHGLVSRYSGWDYTVAVAKRSIAQVTT